ncbi:MAG: UDP-N-acetylmuramoyl-L-alanine--D-glutamate ligase, partial [Povalibacter sp.]
GALCRAGGLSTIVAGNIGDAVLDALEPIAASATWPEVFVLELSSFQLDTTHSLHAAAATVLNVTPDHMDRYENLRAYADSKARIFSRCDAAIVNLDDLQVRDMGRTARKVIGFSLLKNPRAAYYAAEASGDVALMRGNERLALMSELKITGLHNAANALAALAMAEALSVDRSASLEALRTFPGLAHRSQWVADVAGVRYVDDSKGTNVGATLAAVAGMAGTLIVIAGGQGKGQDFTPLAPAFRNKVRHVVLIGQDAQLIAQALEGVCTVEFANDMDAAVRACARSAQPTETVLLSPACASLDMFRDYAHRGDVFSQAVRSLQS